MDQAASGRRRSALSGRWSPAGPFAASRADARRWPGSRDRTCTSTDGWVGGEAPGRSTSGKARPQSSASARRIGMLFFCRQSSVDVRARQDVGDAVNRKSGVAPAKHLRKNRPTPRCFCRPIEQSVMTVRRAPTIVVIGAGILGATLAHRLSVDGWDVTIIDQHPVGSCGAKSRPRRAPSCSPRLG
jgi:FAD dependent oxidoreductase